MDSRLLLSTLLALLALIRTVRSSSECPADSLASYQLTVYTFWSQQAFPKHFPDTRPVAQWSKLYGVSHADNLTLFQVGSLASKSLQQYAELGRTDEFEMTLNHSLVLSQFYAPPIRKGVGLTGTSFFVDKDHSKMSFVMKIHPSPDWFIGLDRLSLCPNRTWLDNLTIDAIPMDAGTDQGFTFTAPDYSNDDPEPVFTISSSYPKEPYGSFYYRNLTALPTMAKFVISKVQEYVRKPEKAQHITDADQCHDIEATLQNISKTLLGNTKENNKPDKKFGLSQSVDPKNDKTSEGNTSTDKYLKDNQGNIKILAHNSSITHGEMSRNAHNVSMISNHEGQINNHTHQLVGILSPFQSLLAESSSITSLEDLSRTSSETLGEFQKRKLKSEIKRNLVSMVQSLQMLHQILESEGMETSSLEKNDETKIKDDHRKEKERNENKENKRDQKNSTENKEKERSQKSKKSNESIKQNHKGKNQENGGRNDSKRKSDGNKKRHDKSRHRKRTIHSGLWIS